MEKLRVNGARFLKAWSRKTMALLERLPQNTKQTLIRLRKRIEELALRHGYGPERYLVLTARPKDMPYPHE